MAKKTVSRVGAVLLAAVMAVTAAIPALAQTLDPSPLTDFSVTLSRSEVSLDVDQTETLTAVVTRSPLDGTGDINVKWSMDGQESQGEQPVITMQEVPNTTPDEHQVKITALSAGKVTITVTVTATINGDTVEKKGFCEVAVRGVGLSETEITLLKGQSKTLTATPYGALGSTMALWSSESPSIAFVTSGGTVTGQNVGVTNITVEIGNYKAQCKVTVEEDLSNVIFADLDEGHLLGLGSLREELELQCQDKLGADETLSHLMGISVPTEQGTLYYHYNSTDNTGNGVGSTQRYYLTPGPGQMDFNEITFVPNPQFSGTAEIQFFGYSSTNNFYPGRIHVTVEGISDVAYAGVAGSPIAFQLEDFAAVYQQATGGSLRYVTFELPSIAQGTLYYDYLPSNLYNQPVEAGKPYYRDRSPELNKVSFVPAKGSSNVTRIPYQAFGPEGSAPHQGAVLVTVSSSGEGEIANVGTVSYEAGESGVMLRGADFNAACKNATGAGLEYLQFTPPDASQGMLYHDYRGALESAVSSEKAYFPNKSPFISDITYVPITYKKGRVTIPFMGANTMGTAVKGTLEIQVNVPVTSAIRYSGNSLPLSFSRQDFESACKAILNRDLAYIQITKLPPDSMGTLYESYRGPHSKGVPVTTDSLCMKKEGEAKAKPVVFLPRAGAFGRTSLSYTGYDVEGESFTGTVEIFIADQFSMAHFTDMKQWKWAVPAVEFLYAMDVVSGISNTRFGPGSRMQRGDFTLMLCKAFGFNTGNTVSFSDVSPSSYYAWAVATAKDLGIVVGDEHGKFHPQSGLLRQDAMVMLQKAMRVAGMDVPDGSFSSLLPFGDRESVSPYARKAMAAMVELGIIIGDDRGRLNPKKNLNRAEMATILHHILTL